MCYKFGSKALTRHAPDSLNLTKMSFHNRGRLPPPPNYCSSSFSLKIYRQPPRNWQHAATRIVAITGLSEPNCCCHHPEIQNFLRNLASVKRAARKDSGDGSNELRNALKKHTANSTPVDCCATLLNFPFGECIKCRRGHAGPGLFRASVANTRQFLAASRRKNLVAAALHWRNLLGSTNHLFLITGSCGLEIVAQLNAMLNEHSKRATQSRPQVDEANRPISCYQQSACRVDCLALGPVSRVTTDFPTMIVQGEYDWLSRGLLPRSYLRARVFSNESSVAGANLSGTLVDAREPLWSTPKNGRVLVPRLGHMGYWSDSRVFEIARRWLANNFSAS